MIKDSDTYKLPYKLDADHYRLWKQSKLIATTTPLTKLEIYYIILSSFKNGGYADDHCDTRRCDTNWSCFHLLAFILIGKNDYLRQQNHVQYDHTGRLARDADWDMYLARFTLG
jgi:hypothetical protein